MIREMRKDSVARARREAEVITKGYPAYTTQVRSHVYLTQIPMHEFGYLF